MAAAMAALPWTTACSPYTITLPGADTIKAGAIGDEGFLAMFLFVSFVPLIADLMVDSVMEGVVDAPPSELSWLSSLLTIETLGRAARG